MKYLLIILILTINLFSENLYPIYLNGETCFINNSGDVKISPEGKYNTINKDLKIIDYSITPEKEKFNFRGEIYTNYKFPTYTKFKNGKASIAIKHWFWFILPNTYYKYCVIDTNGKVLYPESDTIVKSFSENMNLIEVPKKEMGTAYDKKYGFLDTDYNPVIPPVYDFASEFSDGLALVRKEKKYGFINKNNEITIPIIYDDATIFNNGCAGVKKGGKWGFVDKSGKVIIDFKYNMIWKFNDDIALVHNGVHYFYINKNGDKLFNKTFEEAKSFNEGYAKVKQGDYYGFLNTEGNFAIEPKFVNCLNVSEGLIAFQEGKFWGYMDVKGNSVIKPSFEIVNSFEKDLAVVFLNGEQYYINKEGKLVCKIKQNTQNFLYRLFY